MRYLKIAHLTSAHPRYDTRIFVKMCNSLAKEGYGVKLVVADGLGDELKDGIQIIDAGTKSSHRLIRMTQTVRKIYLVAKGLDVDVYHLHDPELLLVALKLKRIGKKVIFDSHEDVPTQILAKPYLKGFARNIIGGIYSIFEKYICSRIDGVITATPHIQNKFNLINKISSNVNNYPKSDELKPNSLWSEKSNQICYIGGITKLRGIHEIVKAMAIVTTGTRLQIAGDFSDPDLQREIKAIHAWEYVDELGFLDRKGVSKLLSKSLAGLVTLHPVENYIDALPVKLFEYMSAGIPVIASKFPGWQMIIEKNKCGICVDPLNSNEIANAINYIISNPDIAKEMGENGRKAIEKEYNWLFEERKLLNFYNCLQ